MKRPCIAVITAAIGFAYGANAADGAKAPEMKAVEEKYAVIVSKNESPGEYIDDSVITGLVREKLFADAELKSAEINVETFKGVVQLSGFVTSRAAINKAVDIAHGVKGVTSVKNDMTIKAP